MIEILGFEEITWKIYEPQHVKDFPCYLCKKKIGTMFLTLNLNKARIKLPVCEDCATMEATEIYELIKD